MRAIRAFLVLGLCMGLLLPAAQPVSAAGIVVNSLADTITNDGKCTLREAIRSANLDKGVGGCAAGFGEDTIFLPPGEITLSIAGAMENDALTGDLDVRESLTIIGAGQDMTVIDGARLDRVFDVPAGGVIFRLTDMTVRRGYPSFTDTSGWEDDSLLGKGGGTRVLSSQSTLILLRARYTENIADQPEDGHGGGIYSAGPLEVRDSLFDKNYAGIDGGAISAWSSILAENTDFVGNLAYGAAEIEFMSGAAKPSSVMVNVNFVGERCGPTSLIEIGAGVSVKMTTFTIEASGCEGKVIANHGILTLEDGQIQENWARDGIIVHYEGDLLIERMQFQGNSSSGDSAGIINVTDGTVRIERSYFIGNSGPALYVQGGHTQVTNSTFSSGNGGGVMVVEGALRLESVTLANLQNERAALEVTGGNLYIHNSLLGYNRDLAGAPLDCKLFPGTTSSGGYNLISVGDGCDWPTAEGDQVGSKKAPIDPLLGPLEYDDENKTKTQPPLPGSPAIDKGDPHACPLVDQRGVTRPQGWRCDIGAHEVEPGSLMITRLFLPTVARP